MESKQTVSLHACLVSRILVHGCLFVARNHLGHLRHSCSPLVFTMSHQSSWWSTSSSWEQREPQWNRAAADGDQSRDRSWTPTKRTSKYEQHDWQSPAGFKTTKASPTILFRARVIWTVVKSTGKLCYGRLLQLRGVPSMDWLDKAWNK